MDDIARHRAAIDATGTQVAFVHMASEQDADYWFDHYGISVIVRISDPDRALYREFGLEEASITALAHPRVWWPWFKTAIVSGRGVGQAGPNWRQLTGVFVIHRGRILAEIRHRNSAARPDYVALIRSIAPSP